MPEDRHEQLAGIECQPQHLAVVPQNVLQTLAFPLAPPRGPETHQRLEITVECRSVGVGDAKFLAAVELAQQAPQFLPAVGAQALLEELVPARRQAREGTDRQVDSVFDTVGLANLEIRAGKSLHQEGDAFLRHAKLAETYPRPVQLLELAQQGGDRLRLQLGAAENTRAIGEMIAAEIEPVIEAAVLLLDSFHPQRQERDIARRVLRARRQNSHREFQVAQPSGHPGPGQEILRIGIGVVSRLPVVAQPVQRFRHLRKHQSA